MTRKAPPVPDQHPRDDASAADRVNVAPHAVPEERLRERSRQRRARRRRREQWVRAFVRNPASAVYGTVIIGALLAAEGSGGAGYGQMVASVPITLLLYWVLHSYAELTGRRLRTGARLAPREIAREMAHEVSILTGAALPFLSVLICWAAGARLETAITVAVWTAVGLVLLIEVVAGLRARLSGLELISQTVVGALLGVLVLVLRIVLH